MALSSTQKAAVRLYMGRTARYGQIDGDLERAFSAIESTPEHEAQITNLIGGSPPGLLALLQDVDTKLTAAHGRLKASQVGSIQLNASELAMLRSEGRRFVTRLSAILGVPRLADVYSGGGGTFGGYIGK